jgi:hypothetical protein
MKRHKRHGRSLTLVAPSKQVQRQFDVGQVTYDLTRLSAETIYHGTALARRAVLDGGKAYNAELVTVLAEKILAGTEAAVIAMRQIAPVQEACLDFWFSQLQQLPDRSMQSVQSSYDGMRLYSECMRLWARLADLSATALLAHARPLRRTVAKNAKRLREAS